MGVFKRGAKKSFSEKPRDVKEIDREYQQHALMVGHKTRLAMEFRSDAEKLEAEIEDHMAAMQRANSEAKEVQLKAANTPPIVTTEKREAPAAEVQAP